MPNAPEYAPNWLPIPSKPWVLVDVHSDAWYPRPARDEASKRFESVEAALAYAQRHNVRLATR